MTEEIHPYPHIPAFLLPGWIVKVQHWYGEVVDLAVTDKGLVMVCIASPKSIWRNQRPEWIVYEPGQIVQADIEEAIASTSIYDDRINEMLSDLAEMRERWIQQLSDS